MSERPSKEWIDGYTLAVRHCQDIITLANLDPDYKRRMKNKMEKLILRMAHYKPRKRLDQI